MPPKKKPSTTKKKSSTTGTVPPKNKKSSTTGAGVTKKNKDSNKRLTLQEEAESAVPSPDPKRRKKDSPIISILQDVDFKDTSTLDAVMNDITAHRFSRDLLESGIAWLLAKLYQQEKKGKLQHQQERMKEGNNNVSINSSNISLSKNFLSHVISQPHRILLLLKVRR